MPTDITPRRSVFNDFVILITDAPLEDLKPLDADVRTKRNRQGPISLQGMVLDAMDDERITAVEAHRLLALANRRLYGNSAGLCRVTKEGDLMVIGSVPQEAD